MRYTNQATPALPTPTTACSSSLPGDYLQHLDADDVLLPGALTRVARLLDDIRRRACPRAALVIVAPARSTPSPRARLVARMASCPRTRHQGAAARLPHHYEHRHAPRRFAQTVAPIRPARRPREDWMWMRVAAEYDILRAQRRGPLPASTRRASPAVTSPTASRPRTSFTLDGIFSDPTSATSSSRVTTTPALTERLR